MSIMAYTENLDIVIFIGNKSLGQGYGSSGIFKFFSSYLEIVLNITEGAYKRTMLCLIVALSFNSISF